jgi:hypothetical protein
MKKFLTAWIVAGLLACVFTLSGVVRAEAGPLFLGPKVSTLGIGGELGWEIFPALKVRGMGNWLGYGYEGDIEDVEYEIDLTMVTGGLVLDLHPFKDSFHLSVGGLYNDMTLEGDANLDATASYDIGGITFTGSTIGSMTTTVEWPSLAPYAGLGWGTSANPDRHIFVTFDLGVLYIGEPDVEIESTGSDPILRARLELEEESVKEELSNMKFWPVVGLGLVYKF